MWGFKQTLSFLEFFLAYFLIPCKYVPESLLTICSILEGVCVCVCNLKKMLSNILICKTNRFALPLLFIMETNV